MLSESETKRALKALDWPRLQAELTRCGPTQDALDDAIGHLLRENELIFPHPDPKKEKERATFLAQFHSYAAGTLGEEPAGAVTEVAELQEVVEGRYRQILNTLAECDISKLAPDVRTSAYITRAAQQYDHMVREMNDILRTGNDIGTFFQGPLAMKEDRPFSPDGVLEGIVVSLTSALLMEAYKNSWFDANGVVNLPALPAVGEDECYKAGSTEVLAFVWRAWRKTEQRLRYIGAHVEEFTSENMPTWAPEGAEAVSVFQPTEEEFYDYVANERLGDRFTQHFIEMHTELNIQGKLAQPGSNAPLAPAAYVSEQEVNAAITLSDILSYSIADDTDTPGGLRLVEWLRGYAVLQQLAMETEYDKTGNAWALVPLIGQDAIMQRLGLASLDAERAARFVAATLLQRESRDMFDCPLIKADGGQYMLFAPAMLNVNLAQVVLAAVSNSGEALDRKGKAFEQDVHRMLKRAGLDAKTFKVKRDGQEYEYDAVLPWDDYIFVFECKHHGLSQRNPIQAYYFALEAKSNANQVNRLADALKKYPDILREKFDVDLSGRTIVPCVLNALPYSRKGQLDGVYFTDASALGRFLQERYCHVVMHHHITTDVRLRHRVAIQSFWEGDKPTAVDLLRHMEKPLQVNAVEQHTHPRATPFHMGDKDWIVAVEFERTAMNIESITKTANVSASAVRTDLDMVATAVRETKVQVKKETKKRVIRKKPSQRKVRKRRK